jgi:hypothetical protein
MGKLSQNWLFTATINSLVLIVALYFTIEFKAILIVLMGIRF